jgi:hypothetical protein
MDNIETLQVLYTDSCEQCGKKGQTIVSHTSGQMYIPMENGKFWSLERSFLNPLCIECFFNKRKGDQDGKK